MVVPKKTPRDIVARIHQETVNGLLDPSVKEKLAKLGVEEMIMKPEDFDARIAREAPIAVNARQGRRHCAEMILEHRKSG
jgi:tripartite-type tricarboxylate transporter receptor subunit TctC